MVGKLMKYEFKALFRVLICMSVVSLVLSCIARILVAAQIGDVFVVLFSVVAMYVALALIAVAFFVSVYRFSQSLFRGEGYMTFSLPVTATQLIVAKALSAIIAMFCGVAVFALSAFIIVSGISKEYLDQIMEYIGQYSGMLNAYFASDPLLIVELILEIIVSLPLTLLILFLLESVGQLFTNRRGLITFGIAVGAFTLISILQGLCLEPILDAAGKVSVHLANWIEIILYAGIDVGCFFATRYILTNKLQGALFL